MKEYNQGWVKLHRKLLDWEWYDDLPTKVLFLHLILKANHTEQSWRGITIKRGQRLTSLEALSSETSLSIKQVRRAIKNLEKTGELGKQTTRQYSLLTLHSYDTYQDEGKQRANEGQTKGKQRANEGQLIKNDKKEKNDNGDSYPTLDDVLNYFDEKGLRAEGYRCFTYYDDTARTINGELKWVTNSGKVIKSWKRACGQWIGRMSAEQKLKVQKESEKFDITNKPTEKIEEYSKYLDDWGLEKKVECYIHNETGKIQWAIGGMTFKWLKDLTEEWPDYLKYYDDKEIRWMNWEAHWWEAAVFRSREFIAKSTKLC